MRTYYYLPLHYYLTTLHYSVVLLLWNSNSSNNNTGMQRYSTLTADAFINPIVIGNHKCKIRIRTSNSSNNSNNNVRLYKSSSILRSITGDGDDNDDPSYSNEEHQRRPATITPPLPSSSSSSLLHSTNTDNNTNQSSRRRALQTLTTTTATLLLTTTTANAGIPEIDSKSGELFSPRQTMARGGSDAARGIKLKDDYVEKDLSKGSGTFGMTGIGGVQPIQNVYETRFIGYLSRFLLNFDPAAKLWWEGQQADFEVGGKKGGGGKEKSSVKQKRALRFAEFAESVEIGLADYFVGSYGSYASAAAAKVAATESTTSSNKNTKKTTPINFIEIFSSNDLFAALKSGGKKNSKSTTTTNPTKKLLRREKIKSSRQGVLNLFALLKTRYNTTSEQKRQLAILFSLISDPDLQPAGFIKVLLGELDDASITSIDYPSYNSNNNNNNMNMDAKDASSLDYAGGGYGKDDNIKISIETPPPFGDDYTPALIESKLKPTSRVLRIKVTDGGNGYTGVPSVKVAQDGVKVNCEAVAILDRRGRVESVLVLIPGFGYGGGSGSTRKKESVTLPEITISAPKLKARAIINTAAVDSNSTKPKTIATTAAASKSPPLRAAKAVAELEYAITELKIIRNGNGYITTQPPKVFIQPPDEDPDWYVSSTRYASARVSKMTYRQNGVPVTFQTANLMDLDPLSVETSTLARMKNDPIALLPTSIRPTFTAQGAPITQLSSNPRFLDVVKAGKNGFYTIPSLPSPVSNIKLPSSQYRAFDPIFGGVGRKPVTKGAQSLTSSEYTRLALSGAVCTVIVRTALNPLELLKTKLQLGNDKELMAFALERGGSVVVEHGGGGGSVTAVDDTRESSSVEYTATPAMVSVLEDTNTSIDRQPPPSVQTAATTTATVPPHDYAESTTPTPTTPQVEEDKSSIGVPEFASALIALRGSSSLFQSADITFLASIIFGGLGFGATELFRRYFTLVFMSGSSGGGFGGEITLLAAAGLACVITSAVAAPFELMRVRSMAYVEGQPLKTVLSDFLKQKRKENEPKNPNNTKSSSSTSDPTNKNTEIGLADIKKSDLQPLFSGFFPIVSREFPFAIAKFLAFDLIASTAITLINSQSLEPVEIGIGPIGLAVSALSGSIAGLFSAFISHPADLVLTLTSGSKSDDADDDDGNSTSSSDWKPIVQDLLDQEGGIRNLYAGFSARATFFFLVIGLQFFLYDYTKNIFQVSSEDLTLVLDVFYAIRQGLN